MPKSKTTQPRASADRLAALEAEQLDATHQWLDADTPAKQALARARATKVLAALAAGRRRGQGWESVGRGDRFGMLLVVERGAPDGVGKGRWLCLCDCGGRTAVRTRVLMRCMPSCGCRTGSPAHWGPLKPKSSAKAPGIAQKKLPAVVTLNVTSDATSAALGGKNDVPPMIPVPQVAETPHGVPPNPPSRRETLLSLGRSLRSPKDRHSWRYVADLCGEDVAAELRELGL